MDRILIDDTVVRLTTEELSLSDLRELEQQLYSTESDAAYPVEGYALAAVARSMVSYLTYVGTDLEKSISLRRSEERQRISGEFSPPSSSDSRAQVTEVIEQWQSIERLDRDAIERQVAGSVGGPD